MSANPDESLDRIDLEKLHDGILAAIRNRFGARLKTVCAYDPVDPDFSDIKTPAVLLELAEMSPGGRTSGGRSAVALGFTAHCMLSAKTEDVQIQVRNFAAQILRLVDGNHWELADMVERPSGLEAFPGMFTPGEKGFESWVVNWKQTVHLGDSWELPDDGPPRGVFASMVPLIGLAHKHQYVRVS